MNNKKILAVLIAFFMAVSGASAVEVKVDFDGVSGAPALPARRHGLAAFIEAAAAQKTDLPCVPAPQAPSRGFPPASGPFCIANCQDSDIVPGEDSEAQDSFQVPPVTSELDKVIVGMVCIKRGEYSSPECTGKTLRQAAALQSWDLLKNIFVDNAEKVLTFHFPVPMSYVLFGQTLYQVQMHAQDLTAKKLQEDNAKLAPMISDSQVEKARKLRMMADNARLIKTWKKEAIFDATRASNWKEIQDKVFAFNGGPAYRQLGKSLMGYEIFRKKQARQQPPAVR